jgi:predicted transcriptional regulator
MARQDAYAPADLETEPAIRPRHLSDPRTMRAVAHPVRIALLDALTLHQPLTATEAGELIGETSTTCSFHLRMLAKYGFVEEAGQAPGRRRPWRLTHFGFTTGGRAEQDTETSAAAAALEAVLWDSWLDRLAAFRVRRHGFGEGAGRYVHGHENLVFVTPEEAERLVEDVQEVIDRHRARLGDRGQRPAGSMPMEMLLFTFPFDGPGAGAENPT